MVDFIAFCFHFCTDHMATVDELIKELREKTKTKNSETKDASLAFNREVKTMIANMAGIEVKCPVCGSTERVKDGEGRFKCKSCGKKYRASTNTILAGYDFTYDEWIKITNAVCIRHDSIKYSSLVGYQMSAKKAWQLKVKFLSAFLNMPQPQLTGIIQVDGTYFRESQKGKRSLISFVYEGKDRVARRRFMPSVCGIYGKEFICCLSGIDNSGHVFAECVSLGTPSYEVLSKTLDKHIINPQYICSDAHYLYENYCDERQIRHHITPSTYKNERRLNGYIERNTKTHPDELNEDELKNNQRIIKKMYEDRRGPHIRNSGKMSFEAYNVLVNDKNKKFFDLDEGINQFHGTLKGKLVNNEKNVSSKFLQAYLALEVYIKNFGVNYGHALGQNVDDYEIVFKDVIKYYDVNKYKELMSNEVKPLEYDEHANIIAKRRVAGGRKFVNLSTTAFNGRKVDAEVPDIFDKRKCFRQMSAFRINYLCRYFKIPVSGLNKTQKCDALAKLPNADEIIFKELYLLYYANDDEVYDAIEDGFLETKNKKRGRKKKGTKTLLSENIFDKEGIQRILNKKYIVIDTETTGLDTKADEILSLTIMSETGDVLFNEMFKPENHNSWAKAETVNHISPEMVKDKKPFKECLTEIQTIINVHQLVVGYNINFDASILETNGIKIPEGKRFDVMYYYTRISGKRHKLKHCASYYGYDWKNKPHTSIGDVEATRYCFGKMLL